jgi:RNA polymerase sigma-70 factor (ECF subfamily)
MLPEEIVAQFLARLDEPTRSGLMATAAVELERAWQAARSAWPTLDVDAARFCAFLAERATGVAALTELRVSDLYLVCACLDGQPEALLGFEALLTAVGHELRAVARGDDLLEEAKQITRQILLPRAERPPPLADYAGRGNLRGWLRVALGREVIRLLRRGATVAGGDTGELGRVADEDDDPETAYLKTHYQREFKEAFTDAVALLDAHERRLLRYAVIERLSVDDIGKLERVHRATAARQVARARERLATETRRLLLKRLRLEAGQLQSVLGLIESQIDVSVQRLLIAG